MGFIKCPECGRKNISESEEICPNCCYGIKAYYDLIKQEEERQEIARQEQARQEQVRQEQVRQMKVRQEKVKQELARQEQARQEKIKQVELKKRQIELAEWKYREECIKHVPRPKGPKVAIPILVLLSSTVNFMMAKWEFAGPKTEPSYDPISGIFFIVLGTYLMCCTIYLFYRSMKRYQLSKTNFEEYQRLSISHSERIKEDIIDEARKKLVRKYTYHRLFEKKQPKL